MLRFSLLTLLGVVLVAAVGSAALANSTDTWRQVVVTGTVGFLLMATSVAIGKRPMSRFAWAFAVTGWIYLVVTFSGVLGVRDHLLTERLSAWLCQLVHEESGVATAQRWDAAVSISGHFPTSYDIGGNPVTLAPSPQWIYMPTGAPLQTLYNFTAIGRSLWTLIVATIGGLFASWLSRCAKLS